MLIFGLQENEANYFRGSSAGVSMEGIAFHFGSASYILKIPYRTANRNRKRAIISLLNIFWKIIPIASIN